MTTTARNIVTVNAGSSSVKLAVFTLSNQELVQQLEIVISNVGQPGATVRVEEPHVPVKTQNTYIPNHSAASGVVREILAQARGAEGIAAIGYRLVHGGATCTSPMPVADISPHTWELLSQLDPQHALAARQLIDEFMRAYPTARHVACFDTAFFEDLPLAAQTIPIPKKYYDAGVRRYGFHGLSYISLLSTFREKAGESAANGRVILAHLGSGASLTATKLGKPIDTTMGFSPASGVTMSTRSGDLDPTIFSFLHSHDAMTIEAFNHMVNFESGLLGVSGKTGDMRALLAMEQDHADAALAVEMFVNSVKKSIGAYIALLGGVDSLLFTGGIGEQSAILRSRICHGLGYAGIEIDAAANEEHSFLISAEGSATGVHVISTDEARVIALQTVELLDRASKD